MVTYLARRIPTAIAVLLIASLLIFSILRLIPGGPESALAGPDAGPEQLAAIRHDLGLDRGFVSQYVTWLGALVTLNLGQSYQVGGDIGSLIGFGLLHTVVLTVTALVIAVIIALALGLAATIYDNRYLNWVLTGINAAAIAVPTFVVGTALILVFGVRWRILPAGGTPPDGLWADPSITAQYLLLPALTLGLPAGAVLARFLTEALRTELRAPYATTARALGVPQREIVIRSALRNALPPALTALGLVTGGLLGGAILVEAIFGWPGLGLLTEQGIFARDYPLVQVLVLLSVAVFVVIQLLADILHAWLDPRIRLAGQ
ncbi:MULTISPECIES: ABC transporter permease [unclassified Gordonia (in: high G+C Gram-positive bacteria)]|uniref:ABC transporter permease n=1 Tax=unclassified Gordonia (in: high G+C Gram-positive bacteria) TaxID=2657482 RepID=UPI0009AC87BD|nr:MULTISPECIES: ABC transporter permease [unclassified Gordonia (in: high G+C Gram-positive bacteria)]MDF3280632.1 ABC transporter permease [Gordonia sp. N1V]OPX12605.1 peptide ABC transporter permease [Gordonia sp. i37]